MTCTQTWPGPQGQSSVHWTFTTCPQGKCATSLTAGGSRKWHYLSEGQLELWAESLRKMTSNTWVANMSSEKITDTKDLWYIDVHHSVSYNKDTAGNNLNAHQ